jgi:hypothetical protein
VTSSSVQFNAMMAYRGVSGFNLGLITNPPAYLLNFPHGWCGIASVPDGSGHVVIGTGLGYNLTGAVQHLDREGNVVDLYQPTPDFISVPGEPTGAFDNPASLNADLAPDGSIDVFAEDDYNGRVLWYNISASRNTRFTGGRGIRDRRKKRGLAY